MSIFDIKPSLSRIKFDGGTFIVGPAVDDPSGVGHVICDRHPHRRIVISVVNALNVLSIQDAAHDALRNCPDCLTEHEDKASWKNTRWPNAGMPGGAEL